MRRSRLTLFTWGYWGWGTATEQFVKAVDAVEKARGFRPPVFVDVRISRSVRAPGFNGGAFERTVGPSRYVWMPELGNRAILEGGRPRINKPAAAGDLLDRAQELGRERTRVLFFCSCEFPAPCHRSTVAGLVLKDASRRGLAIETIEWPGGEPASKPLRIVVPPSACGKLENGARAIPVNRSTPLEVLAGLPWFSPAEIVAEDKQTPLRVLTGPARYDRTRGWWLPNLGALAPSASRQAIAEGVRELREQEGYSSRRTDS